MRIILHTDNTLVLNSDATEVTIEPPSVSRLLSTSSCSSGQCAIRRSSTSNSNYDPDFCSLGKSIHDKESEHDE